MTPVVPVVMTGGAGARLWPVSRRAKPKPFHALLGGVSMLQATLDRVRGRVGDVVFDPPLVVAGERHAAAAAEACQATDVRWVLEPAGRSTAAVAVVAAELVSRTEPARLMLLAPSDHRIDDAEAFRGAVARGAPAAAAGKLVVFGVRPTRPETGYGYILAEGDGELRDVVRFVEKPDAIAAAAYLEDGRYSWNAGVFLLRADRLLEEMERWRPDIRAAAGQAVARAREAEGAVHLDAEAFERCPAESLDRAVMERTTEAVVVALDAGWSDLGDFDALWAASGKDSEDNAVEGDVVLLDSRGCLVSSDGPTVAVVGGQELVVVVRDGAVLVAPRSRAQDVRRVVDRLEAAGRLDRL